MDWMSLASIILGIGLVTIHDNLTQNLPHRDIQNEAWPGISVTHWSPVIT